MPTYFVHAISAPSRARALLFASLTAAAALLAAQTTHYVAPTGDDAAAGTSPATAWRTVQHAMDVATPGATVELADGLYAERLACRVSGTAAAPITFRAAHARQAILDGGGAGDADAVLAIVDRSYVTVEGLVVRNNTQPDAQGILVAGGGAGVTLRGNEVYDIHFAADAGAPVTEDGNAQPLIVYGTSGTTPISALVIEGNLVRDSRTGFSEGLAVNGNVAGFASAATRCTGSATSGSTSSDTRAPRPPTTRRATG